VVVTEDGIVIYDLSFVLVPTVIEGWCTPVRSRAGAMCERLSSSFGDGEDLLDSPGHFTPNHVNLSDKPVDVLAMTHDV